MGLMGFVLAVLSAGGGAALPETPSPEHSTGSALYEAHCALCHGANLKAADGMVDLRGFEAGEEAFKAQVREGRGPMPGFSGVFSDAELAALWAYVENRSEPPESG